MLRVLTQVYRHGEEAIKVATGGARATALLVVNAAITEHAPGDNILPGSGMVRVNMPTYAALRRPEARHVSSHGGAAASAPLPPHGPIETYGVRMPLVRSSMRNYVARKEQDGFLGADDPDTIRTTCALFSGWAAGLAQLHNHNIVYLDGGVRNVMLDCADTPEAANVKLIDFDFIGPADGSVQLDAPLGRNAAPEQVVHLGDVSGMLPAADVFRMGMDAIALLSGTSWAELDDPVLQRDRVMATLARTSRMDPAKDLELWCTYAMPPLPKYFGQTRVGRHVRDLLMRSLLPYPQWRPTAAEFSHAMALAAADSALQDALTTLLAGGTDLGVNKELVYNPAIISWMNSPMESPPSGPGSPRCLSNASPAFDHEPGLASAAAVALSLEGIVQNEDRTPEPVKSCTRAIESHPFDFLEADKEEVRLSGCLHPHSASLHSRRATCSVPPQLWKVERHLLMVQGQAHMGGCTGTTRSRTVHGKGAAALGKGRRSLARFFQLRGSAQALRP
jgi:hypothetical protein